jgi:hypothetical protein
MTARNACAERCSRADSGAEGGPTLHAILRTRAFYLLALGSMCSIAAGRRHRISI